MDQPKSRRKRKPSDYRSKNPKVQSNFNAAAWRSEYAKELSADVKTGISELLGPEAVPCIEGAANTYLFLQKIQREQPRYSEMKKAVEMLEKALDAISDALSRQKGIDKRTRDYLANVMAAKMGANYYEIEKQMQSGIDMEAATAK